MSKIVVAVNVMIVQKDKISNVQAGGVDGEYFFLYDGKYKWSIFSDDEDGYVLVYYPGHYSLEWLSSIPLEAWDDSIEMVLYRVKDIGTKEAKESFAELYAVLNEKKFGMDDVLDDIINSDIPF
ncbi:hypothetical protein PII47_17410 [Pseudomonas sp. 21TX0197]|uniref:hypothetical protein n=1 Tax=unclassified Pseudomonas TaxID=196821 RepID=UPI000914F475|nr:MULTISPECIES: hypothetical protein [unclassified Pseudomonas]MDB6445174.1 hypothetical protein [Pseudomonas sp. 21TX0197]SFX86184.1 hypothetical protein SAMN03159309_03005 [Pseudomonas sp. NFACC36]